MSDSTLAPALELAEGGTRLRIHWPEGGASDYSALWLRDNAPEDRDPGSGQRFLDIADLPESPRIASAIPEAGSVRIHWMDEEKTSRFSRAWLREYDPGLPPEPIAPAPVLWRAADAETLLWTDYEEVKNTPEGRYRWLRAIATQGLAFLRGVPTEEARLFEPASWIGYVRETNYGRLFDVRSEPNPINLAYTNIGLGLHTDNPYREPVPGLQMLHCLQASGEGGESLFADGFALAEHLHTQDAAACDLLTQTPVRFTYAHGEVCLSAERPLIERNRLGGWEAVRYNNRSIAPLRLPADILPAFYAAYRALACLLRDPQFLVSIKLRSGDLVVFDNQRALHGRAPFILDEHPRHLQGCYLDKDSLLSSLRVLEKRLNL